jgi:hypothetical protein
MDDKRKGNLTLDEIIALKAELDKGLTEAVMTFFQRTGLEIKDLDLRVVMGDGGPVGYGVVALVKL